MSKFMKTLFASCYFMFLITILVLSMDPVMAQGSGEGRIVYSRNTITGRDFVSLATGQAVSVTDGVCALLSPNLVYLATVNLQNPDQMSFFDLETGSQISQVTWQSTWTQICPTIQWLGDLTLIIPIQPDPQQVYSVDVLTGDINGPGPAPSPPVVLQADPDRLTALFSPTGQYVAYRRCDQADCAGDSRFVIYDLQTDQVVTELTGHNYVGGTPIPVENFYSWSHSERYLIHYSLNQTVAIYDLMNSTYLDLAFLPSNAGSLRTYPLSWKWSPDDTQVALWVGEASKLGYSFEEGIAIIDLAQQTFHIVAAPKSLWPISLERWGWMPAGESLLIERIDNTLYELNLADGSQTLVDENISEIWFWYAGPPATACNTAALSSAITCDPAGTVK